MASEPRITVVIAAYRPGDGFDRVITSLDAQTLPQEEFETIVVDDGSPDDTFERLSALAATRSNIRVERIDNSGWPSRPRNIATGLARGEYVFFMDHDDSLYPDALRRMAEYAGETRADLLSPKESKTSDAWWGLPALVDGNVSDALTDGGIDRLLPMVPHKLYRRQFLLDHGIRFPEGRRKLWEDIYVNVEAWRHAEHVAVLADTPVYLWYSSATNNSKTYGPTSSEFWDRLDELLAFIDATLDGPEYADARRSALLHQYKGRVLTRLSRSLPRASAGDAAMAMSRARAIQDRYFPEDWDAALPRQVRSRAVLLRAGRADLLAKLWTVDADTSARVIAERPVWRDGVLQVEAEGRWCDKAGEPIGLVRRDGRLWRDLPPELTEALPDEVVDFTDALDDLALDIGVRDRNASVSWQLPTEPRTSWTDLPDGRVAPLIHASTRVDPETAALGAPLRADVHDMVVKVHWDGAERAGSLRYRGSAAPAVLPGRTAVAYRSKSGALSIDLSAKLRNVVADGGSTPGPLPGTPAGFELDLPKVTVLSDAVLPVTGVLRPVHRGQEIPLTGQLTASGGRARVRLSASTEVPDGAYDLSTGLGDDALLGKRPVRISGDSVRIESAEDATRSRSGSPLDRLPKPLARVARGVRRRLRG